MRKQFPGHLSNPRANVFPTKRHAWAASPAEPGRALCFPASCQPATKNQEQMLENHNTQEEKPYAEGRVQHKEIKTKTK